MTGDTHSRSSKTDDVQTDPFAAFEEWASETDQKAFAELAVDADDNIAAYP